MPAAGQPFAEILGQRRADEGVEVEAGEVKALQVTDRPGPVADRPLASARSVAANSVEATRQARREEISARTARPRRGSIG